ncbi:MAG: hypothetical protein ABR985_09000 [Methanotrichaceae archaeon]
MDEIASISELPGLEAVMAGVQSAMPLFTAPKALREQDNWVLRSGKIPVSRTGDGFITTPDGDRIGWNDDGFRYRYDDVISAFEHRLPPEKTKGAEINGVGFIVMRDPELDKRQVIFVDIDACRDPITGEVSKWASEILKKLNSSTELSGSETGFHILCLGKLPDDLDRISWHGPDDLSPTSREHILERKPLLKVLIDKGQPAFNHIEIYENGRHIALTCDWLNQFPSECELRADELNELVASAPPDAEKKGVVVKKPRPRRMPNKKTALPPLRADAPGCLDVSGFTEVGGQLTGPHPVLGSTTGKNIVFDPATGLYCWMHDGIDCGGDGWVWLAHACGALEWDQPGAGALSDRKVLLKVMQYAVDQGVFTEDELFPERKQQKKDAEDAMKVKDAALNDVGLPFKPENIKMFARLKQHNRALYESIVASWKRKVKTTDFDKEVDREIKASKRREKAANQHDVDGHDEGKPTIVITGKHMQDITAECLPAIVAHNTPPYIFVRAGSLVRVKKDEKGTMCIDPLGEPALRGVLARSADFLYVDASGYSNADPPVKVVKDILALTAWNGIPPLTGIIESPVVRPDGSILDQFGYDAATQLYYANGEKLALQVPDNPTREDAKKAAEYIFDEVFSDFPFKDTASRLT